MSVLAVCIIRRAQVVSTQQRLMSERQLNRSSIGLSGSESWSLMRDFEQGRLNTEVLNL